MNHYGVLAATYWRRWLPTRYQALPDPTSFFTALGEQVQHQVIDLAMALEEQLPTSSTGQGYLEKVGALAGYRRQAEEIVLADLVYLPPEHQNQQNQLEEEGEGPDEAPTPLTRSPLDQASGQGGGGGSEALIDPTGMPTDRDHPLWRDLTDDQISPAEFARRAAAWGASIRAPRQPPRT